MSETKKCACCKEAKRLRAQRDYYRRRWIMLGMHWPMWGYPSLPKKYLAKASAQDG